MVVGWSAVYGPPGLPQDVISKWTDTLQKMKKDRGWNKMTKGLGNIVDVRSPADTKAYVEAQYKAYDKALNKMGHYLLSNCMVKPIYSCCTESG